MGTLSVMHSAHCAEDRGVPQVQFLGMALTFLLLCNDRCCGSPANAGSTVDTCSASLLGGLWKNFTYFLRECGTLILKSILRPALLWPA